MNELRITQTLQEMLGISPHTQGKLLLSALVVLVLWLVRRIVVRAITGKVTEVTEQYRWRKTTAYVAFFIAAILLLRIWFHGFGSLSTMLGLISAGIAIALRDPLVNLAGWGFILWRQPFSVGDRVQVGDGIRGDVIDVRIFAFTLMEIGNWVDADQSTGRIIHVPNGRVFNEHIANYSRGFKYLWDEMGVLVTFESDWRKAKEILQEIVTRHAEHLSAEAERALRDASQKFMIFYSKLTPIVYTSVKDSGVMLTMRYLCEPQKRRGRAQGIWEDVLDAFAAHDNIDFAYPTTRVYYNAREGKPGTIPKSPGIPVPPDPNEGY